MYSVSADYRLTEEYRDKAREFVDMARVNARNPEMILCPCVSCRNLTHQHVDIVFEHLVIKGMDPLYTTWVFHGERENVSSQAVNVEVPDTYRLYRDTYVQDDVVVEQTNGETNGETELEFSHELEIAETPLYSGCTKYTRLSAIVVLYKHKAANGITDKGFNELLKILCDMLPQDNTLPDSLYSTKKLLTIFDLGYEKIDACVNDCCLF